MVLEEDLANVERYVAFDQRNMACFSTEFVKQYLAICSEVDVVMKTICQELNGVDARSLKEYAPILLTLWPELRQQKVLLRDSHMELIPFASWDANVKDSLHWWTTHNGVKHRRLEHYCDANLENTLNALAGLYVLELYFVRAIGQRDRTEEQDVADVPNDRSKLFDLVEFQTDWTVLGHNEYAITKRDMDEMFAEVWSE
jgi:hypothetical protein